MCSFCFLFLVEWLHYCAANGFFSVCHISLDQTEWLNKGYGLLDSLCQVEEDLIQCDCLDDGVMWAYYFCVALEVEGDWVVAWLYLILHSTESTEAVFLYIMVFLIDWVINCVIWRAFSVSRLRRDERFFFYVPHFLSRRNNAVIQPEIENKKNTSVSTDSIWDWIISSIWFIFPEKGI